MTKRNRLHLKKRTFFTIFSTSSTTTTTHSITHLENMNEVKMSFIKLQNSVCPVNARTLRKKNSLRHFCWKRRETNVIELWQRRVKSPRDCPLYAVICVVPVASKKTNSFCIDPPPTQKLLPPKTCRTFWVSQTRIVSKFPTAVFSIFDPLHQ